MKLRYIVFFIDLPNLSEEIKTRHQKGWLLIRFNSKSFVFNFTNKTKKTVVLKESFPSKNYYY